MTEAERTYQDRVMPMVNAVADQLPPSTLDDRVKQWREQSERSTREANAARGNQSHAEALYLDGRAFAFERCADELELGLKQLAEVGHVNRAGKASPPPLPDPVVQGIRDQFLRVESDLYGTAALRGFVGYLLSVIAQRETAAPRQSEAERTVASIAAMLGWMNVPPRDTLERDIAALKAQRDGAGSAPPPDVERTT